MNGVAVELCEELVQLVAVEDVSGAVEWRFLKFDVLAVYVDELADVGVGGVQGFS